VFVAPWLAPFPVAVGVLTLCMVALLAATYLALRAADAGLRDDFRRRALSAVGAVAVAGTVALAVAPARAPMMHSGLLRGAWVWPVQAGGAMAAVVTVWALLRRRFALARAAAGAVVSLVIWGWALAQYPYLVPMTITIRQGAAPAATLATLLWALAGGAVILIPSLTYLFRTSSRHD
jgi:cytochrome d ubiquinol oxidase subunit II